MHWLFAGQGVVERQLRVEIVLLQAHALGQMPLRVKINGEDTLPRIREGRGQIDGQGGLPDPAFLIANGNGMGHRSQRCDIVRLSHISYTSYMNVHIASSGNAVRNSRSGAVIGGVRGGNSVR